MPSGISVPQFKELMNLVVSDRVAKKIISVDSTFNVASKTFSKMEFKVDGHTEVCYEYGVAKTALEKHVLV